jgi:hypothetical protein
MPLTSPKDVVGFYFLDLATNYQPPDDLATFLAAGEPPIYIGSVTISCKFSNPELRYISVD